MKALAAYVAAGGSVLDAAELVGIRPSTLKRHLASWCKRLGAVLDQRQGQMQLLDDYYRGPVEAPGASHLTMVP
jgi:hypothetical protein